MSEENKTLSVHLAHEAGRREVGGHSPAALYIL